jgi:hypothetical protein
MTRTPLTRNDLRNAQRQWQRTFARTAYNATGRWKPGSSDYSSLFYDEALIVRSARAEQSYKLVGSDSVIVCINEWQYGESVSPKPDVPWLYATFGGSQSCYVMDDTVAWTFAFTDDYGSAVFALSPQENGLP